MAAAALMTVMPEGYEVMNLPPSAGKDMNDLLKLRKGIPTRAPYEQER